MSLGKMMPSANILYLVFLFGLGFAQDFDCYSNVTECNRRLQAFLLDTETFAFGSNYNDMCSHTPPPLNCVNAYPTLQSIYSRIFNTSDTQDLAARAAGVSVLSVVYNAPAGTFRACDHLFEYPAVVNVAVDPTKFFRHSIQSMRRPSITWAQSDPNELYTVIMYDVQFSGLHSFYINCGGGSWDNCGSTLFAYIPPGYFVPSHSVYVFMLFRQANNQRLDPTQVQTVLDQNHLPANGPFDVFLDLSGVLEAYQSVLGNPIQFNMIHVHGDISAVDEMRDRGFINACPIFVSQLDVLHQVVQATGISAMWSNPKYTESLQSTRTYMTSLSVDMEITYEADAYRIKACCQDYSISKGTHKVDPFATEPLAGAVVREAPWVKITPLMLDWRSLDAMRAQTYVFVMVDVQQTLAPGALNPDVYVHWVITDVTLADIRTGRVITPYLAPAPLVGPNNYMFLLFTQTDDNIPDDAVSRHCDPQCFMPFQVLLDALHVSNPVGVKWFSVSRDLEVMRRYYEDFKVETEYDVCRNHPGFAVPCPSDQPRVTNVCDGANSLFDVWNRAIVVMLFSLLTLNKHMF